MMVCEQNGAVDACCGSWGSACRAIRSDHAQRMRMWVLRGTSLAEGTFAGSIWRDGHHLKHCGFSGEFEFWGGEFIGQPHREVHCAAYAESLELAGDWVRCANSPGAKRWQWFAPVAVWSEVTVQLKWLRHQTLSFTAPYPAPLCFWVLFTTFCFFWLAIPVNNDNFVPMVLETIY